MTKAEKIITLLEQSDALTVNDSPILVVSAWVTSGFEWSHSCEIYGEKGTRIFKMSWMNGEGMEFSVSFEESAFENAKVEGPSIILNNTEGEESKITVFSLVPVDLVQVIWKTFEEQL